MALTSPSKSSNEMKAQFPRILYVSSLAKENVDDAFDGIHSRSYAKKASKLSLQLMRSNWVVDELSISNAYKVFLLVFVALTIVAVGIKVLTLADSESTATTSAAFSCNRQLILFMCALTVILATCVAFDSESSRFMRAYTREYLRDRFSFVCLAVLAVGMGTYGKCKEMPISRQIASREQTEEWKGIMQVLFVLYHYFEAAEVYNLIRFFIANCKQSRKTSWPY